MDSCHRCNGVKRYHSFHESSSSSASRIRSSRKSSIVSIHRSREELQFRHYNRIGITHGGFEIVICETSALSSYDSSQSSFPISSRTRRCSCRATNSRIASVTAAFYVRSPLTSSTLSRKSGSIAIIVLASLSANVLPLHLRGPSENGKYKPWGKAASFSGKKRSGMQLFGFSRTDFTTEHRAAVFHFKRGEEKTQEIS